MTFLGSMTALASRIELQLQNEERKIYQDFSSACELIKDFSSKIKDQEIDQLSHQDIYKILRKIFTIKQLVISSTGTRFSSCNKSIDVVLDEIDQFENKLILSKNGEKQKNNVLFNESLERKSFLDLKSLSSSKYPIGKLENIESGDVVLMAKINTDKYLKESTIFQKRIFTRLGVIKFVNGKAMIVSLNTNQKIETRPFNEFILSHLYSFWVLSLKDKKLNELIVLNLDQSDLKFNQKSPYPDMDWYKELVKKAEPVLFNAIKRRGQDCTPKIVDCQWNFPFELIYSGYFDLKSTWTYWPALNLMKEKINGPAEQ